MRRVGGILFLVLLAACDKGAGSVPVEAGTTTSEATTTTSTSTSTTSTTSSTTSTTSSTVAPTTTTVARPTSATAAPVVATTAAPVARLVPSTTTTTSASAGGSCDPNYSGACVPIDPVDVDCGGGTGNGPSYVYAKNFRVVGTDIYGLDTDHDGIACEG